MDSSTLAYFGSTNPLARKIVQETHMIKALFQDKWDDFDENRQDEILDDYFVGPDVRLKYENIEKTDSYPPSYPVLKIQMGEKIVVDETNDFWTWQDEFSGPFSWKSKSQQDLTLLDLEPEQMTKQSKTRRRNSRDLNEDDDRKAKREFSVQEPEKSLWNSEFKNLSKLDANMYTIKTKTEPVIHTNSNNRLNETTIQTNNTLKVDNSPEEINYAFSRDSFIDTYDQGSKNGKKNSTSDFYHENNKELKQEPVKVPVPKKKYDIEMSVFENPMISQVVEDEESLSSATTSPSHHPLLKGFNTNNMSPSRKPLLKGDSSDSASSGKLYEPPTQSMDRDDRVDGIAGTNDKSQLVSNVDYEDTELIAVDVNSGMHILNDSHGSMSSLNLPKTGFDFLDEW